MLSAVSRSSSSRPRGTLRCVERCCPSAAQARRSETCMTAWICSIQARRRAGLRSFPGQPPQNELVQGQVGDCPAQTAILLLELLQAFHLVGLEPAVLLTPPIIGDLAHADLADRVSDVLALRDHNFYLPQLRDDLFRRVSLLRHCSPPSCQRT